MKYYEIEAEDKYDNIINLYNISDYSINFSTIILHLKSGSIITLDYENTHKAREKYEYFLKLEKKKRKRLKKIENLNNYCDEHY